MSQALFALERGFERRVMYVFQAVLLAVAIYAVVHLDWWLVGICVAAWFFNGLIGQGLQKNRQKSFAALAAGSAGEAESAVSTPDDTDIFLFMRSAQKLQMLAVLTAVIVTYRLGQRWWTILGSAVAAWIILMIGVYSVLAKARRASH